MKALLFGLLVVFSPLIFADVKITTWNIEHLGSDGRGFGGGYGGGSLPLRTEEQLKAIGTFLRDELKSDIIAAQEISIDYEENGQSRSEALDAITQEAGSHWTYYLPPKHKDHSDHSMYVGYIWNEERVKALTLAPLFVPNLELAGKNLFDRTPVIGYFEDKRNGGNGVDFALVNVHLASGQNNDENHLIAMTLVEYRLDKALKAIKVKESDRIILGDFNDNPYAQRDSGLAIYTDALYHHMAYKGYTDFVTEDFHSTRMDANLKSIIDHILVNSSAQREMDDQVSKAGIYCHPMHRIALQNGGKPTVITYRFRYSLKRTEIQMLTGKNQSLYV
jgi:endonuclease/exonuclease/phosphatase family metal-dependent hydrolase